MIRGKRGDGSGISTISKFIIALILLAGLLFIFLKYGGLFDKSLAECPGYCSQECQVINNNQVVGARNPLGGDWCAYGMWDLKGVTGLKDRDNNPITPTENIAGTELGLRCCALLPGREKPSTYLDSALRVEEIKEKERLTSVTNPPRIRAYFLDRELPLRNGEMVDIISNENYPLSFEVENIYVRSTRGGADDGTFGVTDVDDVSLFCNSHLLDEEGNEIPGLTWPGEVCDDLQRSDKFVSEVVAKIDSKYEEKNLELTLSLTQQEGKYNPYAKYDTRFTVNLRIQNPILIGGLTSTYTRDKTLRVSCRGDFDCKEFYWEPVAPTGECTNTNPKNLDEAVYDSEAQGKGTIFLDHEGMSGQHLCVYAVDKTERVYVKKTSFPIHIDRTAPMIQASFHAFPDMYTTVTCTESNQGGSGCTDTVGYYYISRPVDFVGALFSGLKDPNKCPSDRGAYSFLRVDQKTGDGIIPFYNSQDFMVLCVMVEDNAGNNARDILLTYNSWDILSAIANDQLNQGGIGTGYTGYNFWN